MGVCAIEEKADLLWVDFRANWLDVHDGMDSLIYIDVVWRQEALQITCLRVF